MQKSGFKNRARSLLRSASITTLLLLLSLPCIAQAQTFLSGNVNMPAGVVPASSDIRLRIQTEPLDTFVGNGGQQVESSVIVTIPQFSSSVSYSLPLRPVSAQAPANLRLRKLKFDCLSGCSNIAITSTGYWGGAAGITAEPDAEQFDIANRPVSLNINLERADLFTGVITYPEGTTANGNEVISVSLVGSQFVNPSVFTQVLAPNEEDERLLFFLGVPPDQTGGGWSLRLECSGCDERLTEGRFFATTGQGSPLSDDPAQRFIFLKNRNYTNLRLELVAEPVPSTNFLPAVTTILLDE